VSVETRFEENEMEMEHPTVVLLVRFKTSMSLEEVMKVATERAPEFRALPGLQQKYYLQDPVTGDIAGLYLWKTADALAEYRQSELRASIAKAYKAEGEPRVELYTVLMPLREVAT
jgi:quinol monooxygenase YgiN